MFTMEMLIKAAQSIDSDPESFGNALMYTFNEVLGKASKIMQGEIDMFVAKRSNKIKEQIQCGKEILTVEINPVAMAKTFNNAYSELIKAQQGVYDDSDAFGAALIKIFGIVLGDKNTEKILKFYEGNYVEMLEMMIPFIVDVLKPALEKELANARSVAALNAKGKLAVLTKEQVKTIAAKV